MPQGGMGIPEQITASFNSTVVKEDQTIPLMPVIGIVITDIIAFGRITMGVRAKLLPDDVFSAILNSAFFNTDTVIDPADSAVGGPPLVGAACRVLVPHVGAQWLVHAAVAAHQPEALVIDIAFAGVTTVIEILGHLDDLSEVIEIGVIIHAGAGVFDSLPGDDES